MPTLPLGAARQAAEEQLSSGNPSAALAIAQAIVRVFPRDYRTAALSGRAYAALGEDHQAEAELRTAARVDPLNRSIRRWLAECGFQADQAVLQDIPPLEAVGDERASISPAALGHLFMRQHLFDQASSQLRPLWAARPERLDVGVALAEALWRLGETSEAVQVCEFLRQAAPECLTANLVQGQILLAAGQPEQAAVLFQLAQAVDPENERAEELYAWLSVRDEGLAPLQRRTVEVQIPNMAIEIPAEPSIVSPPALSDAEAVQGAGPEQLEVADGIDETAPLARWTGTTDEAVLDLPEAPSLPNEDGDAGGPPLTEASGIEQQAWPDALPPLPLGEGQGAGPPISASAPPPEREPLHLIANADGILATLELGTAGELLGCSMQAGGEDWARQIHRWTQSWQELAPLIELGTIRYGMVESEEGAVHLLRCPAYSAVTVAGARANFGLTRVRLRRRHAEPDEHEQEQDWN